VNFDFITATRIVFGPGRMAEAGSLVRNFGRRVLLVVGGHPERADRLRKLLAESGLEWTEVCIPREPTVADVISGAELARQQDRDVVVSLGGGAVLDAGKAIAALATNPGDPLDFLEVIGRAQPLRATPLPFLALPTTAGTGAEVTRNAVLGSPSHRVKVSLRSPLILPRVALVDPDLTRELPPALTATTGLDALTQLLETYVSIRANPLTDALCREALPRIGRALPRAWADGNDRAARTDMALASLFSGLALANAGLGAVHGFAGPLGGMFDAPHGALCAALLAPVTRANLAALRARAPESSAGDRYLEAVRLLGGPSDAPLERAAGWLETFVRPFQIPRLAAYGVRESDFPDLLPKVLAASSTKGNPIALTPEELVGAFREAV
jgi:alcohol dehydrogenase class IV